MYKRIMGFFGGVTSESSEENQELTEERNNEGHHQSEEKNTILGTSVMAAGEEAAVLRDRVIQLEKELRDRIAENESYKNRLQLVEKELSILKNMAISDPTERVSTGVGENDVKSDNVTTGTNLNIDTLRNENTELKEALSKTSELLKDKSDLCENQEKQNEALTNQVSSLKEVVTITKDLLNIRNMEVRHLQSDVESMEGKISEEKKRHNAMIGKMDEAVKLNSDLKQEYGKQLQIFQDLKGKYEDKVAILMKENKKLEGQLQMSKVDAPLPPDEGSNDNASQ